MLSGETPRNCSFSFCVMSNACRFAISTSWLNTKARPFRFPGSWSPAGDCACCFEPGERSVATKAFCNALVKLRTCPTNSLTSRLSAAISPRWPVAVLRREVSSPLFSLRAMRATSNRNDSENAVMVGGDVGVGWDADHSNDPVPPGSHQQRHRSKRAYLPAFSALRLAALGSTTALNFAPGTNLGTVEADQLHGIAFLHGRLDGIDQCFQDCTGCGLGQIILGSEDFNELSAIHRKGIRRE